jgi:hypothetical protein
VAIEPDVQTGMVNVYVQGATAGYKNIKQKTICTLPLANIDFLSQF